MKHMFVILLLTGTLWAAQDSVKQVTAKPWEKILGAWRRVPGPDDPTMLKIEPEGGGIKMSFGSKQDGSCPDIIIVSYDGKPYKAVGSPTWEASFRKTGNQTMQEDGYSSGKPSIKVTWQLSPDETTLTRTYRYINPPGSKDKDVAFVYDRSGGPVSKDDPFIGFWKRDWNKSDLLISTYTSNGDVFTVTGPDGVTSERNCDGKDHPNAADTTILYSCHFTDPHTDEVAFKKNGKLLMTRTNKISEDGKNMVSTLRNADGKTTSEETFEKANRPRSQL